MASIALTLSGFRLHQINWVLLGCSEHKALTSSAERETHAELLARFRTLAIPPDTDSVNVALSRSDIQALISLGNHYFVPKDVTDEFYWCELHALLDHAVSSTPADR
jgi:hypothetical protein